MLMHQGIGLDRFNAMPNARAVHALFECCCCVTWAARISAGRPYRDHDDLHNAVELELLALSPGDLERTFDTVVHEACGDRTVETLAKIVSARVERMLGPEGGYPEY
ncbi:2-oxo-4-hydroxy-4-carboxy-5-ureidoimidazoline decarboxylase [Nocardia sp. NPDC057353]|uniref:2-oxo-4-hydroxy-4-carboxy-5-ureidoimidazoline decarboxylase n=1 Tax=Nocardia sp. NPDC057353 TaxID=3346104 RepID=UPI0036385630